MGFGSPRYFPPLPLLSVFTSQHQQPILPVGCNPGADAVIASEIEDATILIRPRLRLIRINGRRAFGTSRCTFKLVIEVGNVSCASRDYRVRRSFWLDISCTTGLTFGTSICSASIGSGARNVSYAGRNQTIRRSF